MRFQRAWRLGILFYYKNMSIGKQWLLYFCLFRIALTRDSAKNKFIPSSISPMQIRTKCNNFKDLAGETNGNFEGFSWSTWKIGASLRVFILLKISFIKVNLVKYEKETLSLSTISHFKVANSAETAELIFRIWNGGIVINSKDNCAFLPLPVRVACDCAHGFVVLLSYSYLSALRFQL